MFILNMNSINDEQKIKNLNLVAKPKISSNPENLDDTLKAMVETSESEAKCIIPLAPSGDINEDKNVDKEDLRILSQVLQAGDMNHDGKVDAVDFDLLHKSITEKLFRPTRELQAQEGEGQGQATDAAVTDEAKSHPIRRQEGDVNGDGKVDYKDLQFMYQAMKHGDMNGDKVLNKEDYKLLDDKITPAGTGGFGVAGTQDKEDTSDEDIQSEDESRVMFRPPDGDIDESGKTNDKDLSLLKNVLKEGDVNKDGKIDKTDFDLINQKIMQQLFHPFSREAESSEEDQESSTAEDITKRPIRIGGDVNGDKKVDYKDLQLMLQAMKHADMNGDKKIDETDVKALAEKIGPQLQIETDSPEEPSVSTTVESNVSTNMISKPKTAELISAVAAPKREGF